MFHKRSAHSLLTTHASSVEIQVHEIQVVFKYQKQYDPQFFVSLPWFLLRLSNLCQEVKAKTNGSEIELYL